MVALTPCEYQKQNKTNTVRAGYNDRDKIGVGKNNVDCRYIQTLL